VLGLSRFTLYMQDYGGPIGFRMALAHSERGKHDLSFDLGEPERYRKMYRMRMFTFLTQGTLHWTKADETIALVREFMKHSNNWQLLPLTITARCCH
jgi:hypothetical protein